MNDYELMTILHPRLNADDTTATVEAIQGRITDAGGNLLSTDVWGRRRLAYPIQHVLEGTYVLFTFEMAPTSTRTVESWLGISESVLRHLLIRGIIPYQGPDQRGGDRDHDRDHDRDDRDRDRDRDREEPRDAPQDEAPVAEAPVEEPAAEPIEVDDAADEAPADDAGEPETADEARAAAD
jgi:small subunit ribosomal protein S6